MSKTITNLSTLKINYLTSQQYQTTLEAGEIDLNELYLIPASSRGSVTYNEILSTGTAINAYTSLTTGDSVDVTPGTAASLSYTAKSIPNISVSSKTVVTGLSE